MAISTLAIASAGLAGVALLVSGRGAAAEVAVSQAALGLDHGVAATVFKALGLAAGVPIWFAIVATIAVVIGRFRPRRTGEFVGIMVLTEVATSSLKLLIDRARPLGSDAAEILTSAGFPSGHVTRTAVACAFVLTMVTASSRVRICLGLAALSIVSLMGLARVASGAHYVTDVLGGALLAASVLSLWQLSHDLRSGWSTRDLGGRDDAETPSTATR
ncbi:MAG: phosphatase PAP2 family protein [Candidatus Limnocylindrales bacterium]